MYWPCSSILALKSDSNSGHSSPPFGSSPVCKYDSSKSVSLSFPIKRSTATLHKPPSVFAKSLTSKPSPKRPCIRQDTPSPNQGRENFTDSKNVQSERSKNGIECRKVESNDKGADLIENNDTSFQKDQHCPHKKKRKNKEQKKYGKKHSGSKSDKDENEESKNKEMVRKNAKRKIEKSPIQKTLVAAYISDDEDKTGSHKCPFPATLPRVYVMSSLVVLSERNKPSSTVSPPRAIVSAPATKVTKDTAKSTWDSSDSDFEETIAKALLPRAVISKSPKTSNIDDRAMIEPQQDRSVSNKHSCSLMRSRTDSSSSESSSSCSSRRRSYSSRSYCSRWRSYYTSTSSRSSSRSYSYRERSRHRGHRRHGRHRHRRSSTRSLCSRGSSSSSSGERESRPRRRYSRNSDSYRKRSSYRSYSSRSRLEGYTSSERSCTLNSQNSSRTPPPAVCRRAVNRHNLGGTVTAASFVGLAEARISGPLGNKSTFIRGHNPSEAVAAAASAAVRKITGRAEPSPLSTPPALPNVEEPDIKVEKAAEAEAKKGTDSGYIGPQVPPSMAKKLGLCVFPSSPSKSQYPITSNSINVSNSVNNSRKAYVGAKRKSEKTASEDTKKEERIRSDFMTPPEKDDQFKALQEQAKEHVRQQIQQSQFNVSQQQLAAAAASVNAAQTTTMTPAAMLPDAIGQLSVMDQLRQRQQLCLLSGDMDQAIVLENLIRQHQQEAVNVLQQQQTWQMLALQQQQQSAILAAQHQQVQSAQQAALLLATQQHQATASHADNTVAAAMIVAHHHHQQQQQQAIIQAILHQRQQQALVAAAAQQQQQQQIQMMLQIRMQQQAADYANAVAPLAVTTPAVANGSLSGAETVVPSGSEATSSRSPTVLAAVAAAQRHQAFQQDQLQKQVDAAALASATANGMNLPQQQREQKPATAPMAATSPGCIQLPSAVQQQIAAAALHQQQQVQSQQQQQQQHAVALLLAAQQSRMLRPS